MTANRFRRAWPLAASLFATALLAFSLGVLATAWAVVEAGAPPHSAVSPDADMASEPSRLRFAMVPPVRVAAAEAAVLLPELFSLGMEARMPDAPEQDAYTLQLGIFLLPERAEAAGREAVAKGFAPTTRLIVDGRGRAWYQVTGGRFSDRISAEWAARAFLDAYPIADAGSRRSPATRSESWSRG